MKAYTRYRPACPSTQTAATTETKEGNWKFSFICRLMKYFLKSSNHLFNPYCAHWVRCWRTWFTRHTTWSDKHKNQTIDSFRFRAFWFCWAIKTQTWVLGHFPIGCFLNQDTKTDKSQHGEKVDMISGKKSWRGWNGPTQNQVLRSQKELRGVEKY